MLRLATVLLCVPVAVVSCSTASESVNTADAWVSPDDRRLEVVVDSCNADLAFDVSESDETVVIAVTATNDSEDDCQDGFRLELESQLGDRVLIDAYDNGVLEPRSEPEIWDP